MIYIIISNVGMAIMMIFIYFRYSRFRISTSIAAKNLQKKCDEQAAEITNFDNKITQATKTANEKVEALLREVDELRKEKENEIKLRLNAEKQIELTLQKAQEVEKRMEDWRVMQDAVMKDSKDAMLRIGNDLYKKLSENYKHETEVEKNLLGKVSKNITELFDKAAVNLSSKPPERPVAESHVAKSSAAVKTEIHGEDPAKKVIADLVETMKASGHLANKNYFLPANFDEQKAKLLLCEVVFVSTEKLYILDFKAFRYLEEYRQLKSQNKPDAEVVFRQKMDKYLSYLANPKYRDSILKVLSSSKVKFEKNNIVIAVPGKAELQIMKEMNYAQKAQQAQLEIMDIDDINNLVL